MRCRLPDYLLGMLAGLVVAGLPLNAQNAPTRLPTLRRLEKPYLEKVHAEVGELAKLRREVKSIPGYRDWRCILHAHSYLSHDSRGTIAEIAAAARQIGVHAVFISDHPQEKRDVVTEGKRGVENGVLFVPGSETRGFLLYPGDGKLPDLGGSEQQIVDRLRGGMVFVAHPEEHTDWTLSGLTGMEIYNTHADLKDEKELLAALQPKDTAGYARLLNLLNTMQAYPREAFAALFDPPAQNLARYDALCKTRIFAAIAANDSHQNTGFVVFGTDDGKYRVEDALGEPITTLDPAKNGLLKLLFGEPKPGKELFRRMLDPYPVSMGYVSTHVLAPECTEPALRKALAEGRTYVAFDWIADPTGTAFTLAAKGQTWTLGDSVKLAPGLAFHAETPLPATLRLMRDGQEVAKVEGRTLEFAVKEPGVYRLEAALPLGGEQRPWIYTGAIRIMPAADVAITLLGPSVRIVTNTPPGGYQAFPDVCRLKNGDLLCVFYAGYDHVSHPNAALPKGGRLCAVRSTDEGKTWSVPWTVLDTPEDDRDPSICCLPDGTLLCNFFTYGLYGEVNTCLTRSIDNGKTWSEPEILLPGYATSTPIRRLRSGRLVLLVYYAQSGEKRAFAGACLSDDNGKTWSSPHPIGLRAGKTLDETDIYERKDGTLLAVMREVMCGAESKDGGKTWGPVFDLGFPGHCPSLLMTRNGVLLMAHRVPKTSLHYSTDEGRTWQGPLLLDNVIGAYPSLLQLRDGTILCLYYEEKGEGTSSIHALRLKVERH